MMDRPIHPPGTVFFYGVGTARFSLYRVESILSNLGVYELSLLYARAPANRVPSLSLSFDYVRECMFAYPRSFLLWIEV